MTVPRMLVVDLDGTTLTAQGTLHPRDIAAARALKAAGVHVTIATGRLFTGTRWVAEALGIEGEVAVMNGSERVDVPSGEARHGRYLDAASREIVRTELARRRLSTFLFESRRIHHAHADDRHAPYLGVWTLDLCAHEDVFEHAPWSTSEEVLAVGAAGEREAVLQARSALQARLPPELETVVFTAFSGETFLKLRSGLDDKGTALTRMAAARGLTPEDCVAVGDWLNDVPMLRVAGRSFAMGHAKDDVKSAAKEVLEAAHDGGAIAEVAARVWSIEG